MLLKSSLYPILEVLLQPNSPASVLPNIPSGSSPLMFQFQWRPACSSIRYRPFDAIFKVADNGSPTPLVDMKNWSIKVIGPAPTNVKTKLDSNGILLTWNRDTCVRASAYKIFRRVDSSYWNLINVKQEFQLQRVLY